MGQYGYNARFLTRDGIPWAPVMGEIHYSRLPKAEWLDRLRKMKTGGVDIVSSYVIWIHHEEEEGKFRFDGSRDLRHFVECCRDCGLLFFLRIGPWSHAEVRHGGLPDWLFEKGFEPRHNYPEYFRYVDRFYRAVYDQVAGLFEKDHGPIIGVQIENEYGHCGGLSGEAGEEHMRTLTRMCKEVGFDVPYLTATGWGGAITAGLLPVMGGYCDAPWDPRITEIEPSGNFIFTHERNDHSIGSDYGINETLSFDPTDYPYLTAELGGGLQVTHRRRPVASGRDIGAMSIVKLGSGANLLGYYMYGGGTNPKGLKTPLQESKSIGDANDLPEWSYDFRAPIREYGQLGEAYGEIKCLALFLQDFGASLCEMDTRLPESNPLLPKNTEQLRTAIRSNGRSGYIFVNNYQRRQKQAEHRAIRLAVSTENGDIEFPTMDICDGDAFFLPFNMSIGSAVLESSLATPLCVLNQSKYIFYTDLDPSYKFRGEYDASSIITITRAQARQAFKLTQDQDYLVISEASVFCDGSSICFESGEHLRFKVFPDFSKRPGHLDYMGKDGVFYVYEKRYSTPDVNLNVRLQSDEAMLRKSIEAREAALLEGDLLSSDVPGTVYAIDVNAMALKSITNDQMQELKDVRLRIHYQGDRAKLFVNGNYVNDNFWSGPPWEIAIKEYGYPESIEIQVYPLLAGDPIYLEYEPRFTNGVACSVESVEWDFMFETRVIIE